MPELLFNKDEQEQIVQAIREAEKNTSGEIKVHVEKHCPVKDVMDHAKIIFSRLNLQETKLRNGVLFYLAVEDRKFAILGDFGIDKVVPANFWDAISKHVRGKFKEKKYSEGLCEGIKMAGEQLKTHFPYQSDDENEISDEISFGSN